MKRRVHYAEVCFHNTTCGRKITMDGVDYKPLVTMFWEDVTCSHCHRVRAMGRRR